MPHVCDTCSGTQFETVDGYFYCQECGTQSQHQQVEMEADAVMLGDQTIGGDTVKLKVEKKINSARITSWEEYNYILVGLVEEMINVGANSRFKKIVLKLWTKYLHAMEAGFFSLEDECLPRLPMKYQKKDAEILYNKHHRKRLRRRSASCSSADSLDSKSSNGKAGSVIKSYNISKIIKKTKEDLARAQYEDYKKLNDSSSVATSLATTSNRGSEDEITNVSLSLNFTRHARKAMKKKMPKTHIKKHAEDHEDVLDCHRKPKHKTRSDILEHLDNTILIGIIALALNITQDAIQLSDIIRFIREGHLSNHNIRHLLPENIKQDVSNFEGVKKKAVNNHLSMRIMMYRMCRDIPVPELVPPNIHLLTNRYVDELQLPEELKFYLAKLISFHPPLMEFNLKSSNKECVPNYEGRAISYILFTMKLLFGLDNEREYKISESAQRINSLFPDSPEMHLFVVEDWLKMLKMRQLAVQKRHMPSAQRPAWAEPGSLKPGVGNWRMYVDHVKTVYESKIPEHTMVAHTKTDGIRLAVNTMCHLSGINPHNDELMNESKYNVLEDGGLSQKSFHFRASLTPYRDYVNTILVENSKMTPLLTPKAEALLRQDFSSSSMKIFYDDETAIKELSEQLKRQHSLNLQVNRLELQETTVNMVDPLRFVNKLVTLQNIKVDIITKEEAEEVAKQYGTSKTLITRKPKKVEKPKLRMNEIQVDISNMDYWTHYTPYRKVPTPFTPEAWSEELRIMPNNFKFLLFECSRITEQEPRHLFLQLAVVEGVLLTKGGAKDLQQDKCRLFRFW